VRLKGDCFANPRRRAPPKNPMPAATGGTGDTRFDAFVVSDPGVHCAMATPARERAALSALSCPLLHAHLHPENSRSASSPPKCPPLRYEGGTWGGCETAERPFSYCPNHPTPNPRPAGGGFPPLRPLRGNEERPEREDAFFPSKTINQLERSYP
jgi:hypothetical protein